MAGYTHKTPTKIPPDKDELYDASPMLSVRVKQNTADLLKQQSIQNLTTIMNLIEQQISLEEDYEILNELERQKANILKIIKKKSGKESNFKTTENKTISELQIQVSKLEKSVDQKFNIILKSIENGQSTVNSWAQIAAQNAQNVQTEQKQQASKTASKETQKQPAKQTQKQTQEQKQKQELTSFQSRKLIVHVKAEIWENFNSYQLRNQINDAFFQKEGVTKSVVASVTRSKTGFSVILITMPDCNADFLLEKQQIWSEFFGQNLKSVEKSTYWHKIVVHGVSIQPFSTSDGLFLLKDEIETFNPGLKLTRNPSWLSSEENRQNKLHASIVFAVNDAEQAKNAVQKMLYIAGTQLTAEQYKSADIKTQCQKCQKFGHATRHCVNQNWCQICAKNHNTKLHRCQICNTTGVECPHAKLKCKNCGEDHRANSQICSFWEKQPVSPANSDITMKNSSNFAVIISNDSKKKC